MKKINIVNVQFFHFIRLVKIDIAIIVAQGINSYRVPWPAPRRRAGKSYDYDRMK